VGLGPGPGRPPDQGHPGPNVAIDHRNEHPGKRRSRIRRTNPGFSPKSWSDVEKEFTSTGPNGIAHVGSAALDNEECYLIQKLVRSWGLVCM